MSEERFQGRERDSDDCEEGTLMRFKIDDSSLIKDNQIASNSSEMAEENQRMKERLLILEEMIKSQCNEKTKKVSSMSKDVNNVSILNGLQSNDQIEVKEFLSVKESCNVSNTFNGAANNNIIHVSNTFNITKDPTNVIRDESSTIIEKTVTKEVFPYDKEIIELIWKHLSFEDKTDCTLVCNRFNDIISNINCFCLVLQFDSMIQIIPTVSRHYKKLVIQEYRCKNLSPAMHKMLKYLSKSVTDLTLDCCEFDIIALSEFIRELPLLESLKLNVFIAKDSIADICEEDLPKFSQLKHFHIKVNDKLNGILDIIGSASNIQSLTLFDAIFDIDMIKNKSSLTSLSLTKCIVVKSSLMSNLGSLHFSSNVKKPKIVKQSNQSVIDLTLDDCEFDIIALSKFLGVFPLLESLTLNVFITIDSIADICEEDLPNLKQLKDFHIKPNDKLNEILNITRSASNIQSFTLFDAIFDENLIKYLINNKNSLTTLSLTKCIMDKSLMSNLNSLHFGSNVKISSVNFKSFECLNKLRKLELININNEVLGILKKEWVKQLEECTITFNFKQSFDVQRYFNEGFYKHFTGYETTEYFRTFHSDDRKSYCISLEKLNKKMIEYFNPQKINPTVDDINNSMCYFKMTPITKTDSIIPSSLWQDILIAQAKERKGTAESGLLNGWSKYDYAWNVKYDEWCLWDKDLCREYYFWYREDNELWNYYNECEKVYSQFYEEYNKLGNNYDYRKEEYDEWRIRNLEWYKEYYKCYKRDDLWWEDCDDFLEEYLEWWEGDQEWKKQYYKCYKRKYEWWEISEDWQDEYDEWVDGYHEWCEEYYDWYREYYNYNKKYDYLSDSRGVEFWSIDFDNWYNEYEKYNDIYEQWCKMGNKQRRNYEDRIRRFNNKVKIFYIWGKKNREQSRYYENWWRRYNTYDKEYDEWCDEYGELFLEDNKCYDMDGDWYDLDYEDYRFKKKEKYKYKYYAV